MTSRGALGWMVLCGTAGVMIGSALVAEPPVAVDDERSTGLFAIGPSLTEGRSELATTSFALPAGAALAGTAHPSTQDCFVVPSARERGGGEVTLASRVPAGADSALLLTVEREAGPDVSCDSVTFADLLYRGPVEGLVADAAGRSGVLLADAGDERVAIRVRIEPSAGGTAARGLDATIWLDVRHRTAADR